MKKSIFLLTVLLCFVAIFLMTSCFKRNETGADLNAESVNLQDISEQKIEKNEEEKQEEIEQTNNNEADKLSDSPQSEGVADTKELDLNSYSGHWYSEDYFIGLDEAGSTVFYGTEIILNMEEAKIQIITTSIPPASRIAYVETQIKIADSKATFTFDDDAWGNGGEGTIIFKENEIVVNIDIKNYANSNWSIFSGEKVFTKD